MFVVIGLMLSGMLVGFMLRSRKRLGMNKIITLLIWMLLFLLGNEVGGNRRIIESLGTLGMEAVLITLSAVMGSCLAAWGLWSILYKKRGGQSDER